MGLRITWFAVRGKSPDAVLGEAGFVPTGTVDEYAEGPISGLQLDDWYVVQFARMNERAEDPEFLSYLSAECELVMCSGNETAMISSSAAWVDGDMKSSVQHDSAQGSHHVECVGELPDGFDEAVDELRAQQRAADEEGDSVDCLYGAPLTAARLVTGYQYDQSHDDVSAAWQEIAYASAIPFPNESGIADLRMVLESQPEVVEPGISQIETAVRCLSSRGGPSFLILEGFGDDYAQAAGGKSGYTAEWRQYRGSRFRHFVAGRPENLERAETKIDTNGYVVTVFENERLRAEDVVAILTAYALRRPRPDAYLWRDTTDRFQ